MKAGIHMEKFLPPSLETDENGENEFMRAVIIVDESTEKGTARHSQEYENPAFGAKR